MDGGEDNGGCSREEGLMLLLLAVLIPIMLLASNLDLKLPVERTWRGISDAGSEPVWRVDAVTTGRSADGRIGALPRALPEDAVAASTMRAPDAVGLGAEEPEANGAGPLSLMALDFSLNDLPGARARVPSTDSPLKVKKPVYAGGQLVGHMEITVAGEGQLLLEAGEVRALMGQQPGTSPNSPARIPEQGPVSFATLREIGIDLRYSPTEDVIKINP